MRIAMVSTPFVPVPPPRYGGTELIVAELAEGLSSLGHEVTLFATGDSRPPPEIALRSRFPTAIWPPQPYAEIDHASFVAEQVLADGGFDLVHAHIASMLPFAPLIDAPMLYTIHHDAGADYEQRRSLYARSRVALVAISARQRLLMPELHSASVIHHGLSPWRYRFGAGDGGYCAFVGRLSRDKRADVAIDVAHAAKVPILVGGSAHAGDLEYFERELAPRLALPSVTALGEVGGHVKRDIFARASALLFPIDWEEPFGLVMIEAMLSGTPVLAFARGSVPEIVEDGVTGYLCRDADDMAARLRGIGALDRVRVQERALERFSAARMVREYLSFYQRLVRVEDVRTAPTVA